MRGSFREWRWARDDFSDAGVGCLQNFAAGRDFLTPCAGRYQRLSRDKSTASSGPTSSRMDCFRPRSQAGRFDFISVNSSGQRGLGASKSPLLVVTTRRNCSVLAGRSSYASPRNGEMLRIADGYP